MHPRFQWMAVAALMAVTSTAHGAAQDLVVQVPQLSHAAAVQLVDACITIEAKANIPAAVAVVDPAGQLMHFDALQGASPTAPRTALLKAETAARWRRSTAQLSDEIKKGGNSESIYLGDFPVPGGVPIVQGTHTLGAIGVSGPGDDNGCALAAVKAVFGDSVTTGRALGNGGGVQPRP